MLFAPEARWVELILATQFVSSLIFNVRRHILLTEMLFSLRISKSHEKMLSQL